jgi:hypothetical protein
MTDWYSRDQWAPQPRWSCDPEWQWPGVETHDESVLWHKRKLEPPYAMAALMGAASVPWLSGTAHYDRDLNLVLGGNGKDLKQGFTVRVMGRGRGCELWRGDALLARNKDAALPAGHSLHHIWWKVRAIVDPDRVRVFFDGSLVIDQTLETPAPAGQLGLWTHRNSISVGRVTIAAHPPESSSKQ